MGKNESVLERGKIVICDACGRTYASKEENSKECKDCARLRSLGLEPKRIRN